MSTSSAHDMAVNSRRDNHTPPSLARDFALLAILLAALLAPWLARPLSIDDPLFVWTAQHLATHPGDFYGFEVNWYGQGEPMYRVTQNPPLAGYYLAAWGHLLGFGELTLHLVMFLPALAAAWGTYRLAERFSGQPLLAALLGVLSPAFLVSATTLMCDMLLVALWNWSIICWVRGLDERRARWLLVAGCLAAAAVWTKYFGVCLAPLLAVYSFARQPAVRDIGALRVVGCLAVPVAAAIGYELLTRRLYGIGLLAEATLYASQWSGHDRNVAQQALLALVMCGGCLPAALLMAPWLWSRRALLGLAAGAIAASIALALAPGVLWPGTLALPAVSLGVHAALFGLAGVLALAVAVDDWRASREADSLLIVLWLLGTFTFAAFVNWTTNARSLLPIAAPLALLLVRRLRRTSVPPPTIGQLAMPLIGAALLALVVAWADTAQADAGRRAADYFAARRPARQILWYQGHWGWQYYMDRHGARHTDRRGVDMAAGDLLAIPVNNTNVETRLPLGELFVPVAEVPVATHPWLTTMQMNAAGFYGGYGPLPYAFGPHPPETYYLFKLSGPYRFEFPQAAPR